MKMNKIRSNSEFYFNLYQKLNKELLEDILDIELGDLLLEKYYMGQKIDLYGMLKGTTTQVFIESMLKKSDNRHLDFILKLIENIENNAIIIFQAEAFTDKIIEKILRKVKETGKSIDFYAIEIDKKLIKEIEDLNYVHFLKVIDRLCILNSSNPLNMVEKNISIKKHEIGDECEKNNMSKIEKRNELLINAIRKRMYYYPTIHRERRCMGNRVLTYGAGRTGIDYAISIEDRAGDSFVGVRFAEETEAIYKTIKTKSRKLEEKIGYHIDFDDVNLIIKTDLIDKEFIYKTIDGIADIFELYVFYLTNYISYLGTNEEHMMINQHKEGTL